MASYSHMRYNPAKNIVYDVFQAAEKMKVPILIIDAGKEELMDITQQGGRVAEILKRNGAPHKYQVIKGMGHYGIYGKHQEQITKSELDWFDTYLKTDR